MAIAARIQTIIYANKIPKAPEKNLKNINTSLYSAKALVNACVYQFEFVIIKWPAIKPNHKPISPITHRIFITPPSIILIGRVLGNFSLR